MTISGAIARLQVHADALDNVQTAPAVATESISSTIFAVSYLSPQPARVEFHSQGVCWMIFTLFTDFHVPATSLTNAIPIAEAFIPAFVIKLRDDPTLDGAVTEVNAARFSFGGMKFGDDETIGVRFETDCKIFM
jgi:hypothetical protein